MQGIFEFIEVSIFIIKDILWSWNDRVKFEVDVKITFKWSELTILSLTETLLIKSG